MKDVDKLLGGVRLYVVVVMHTLALETRNLGIYTMDVFL